MQVHTKESIHALLDKSPAAVARAVEAIYARQTEAERASEHTSEANGVGFSRFDAEFLTSMVKAYRGWGALYPEAIGSHAQQDQAVSPAVGGNRERA